MWLSLLRHVLNIFLFGPFQTELSLIHMFWVWQVEVLLSFSEASKGCTKHMSFDAEVPCDSCSEWSAFVFKFMLQPVFSLFSYILLFMIFTRNSVLFGEDTDMFLVGIGIFFAVHNMASACFSNFKSNTVQLNTSLFPWMKSFIFRIVL